MTSSDYGLPHPSTDQLSAMPLLASLSSEQLADLAELIELHQVSAGEAIVREGGDGYAFYFLFEGTAEVRHGDTVVSTLGPQDFFGEIAMIENVRRTASVVAVEPCVVGSMFGTVFRVLEASSPAIAQVLHDAAVTRHD